MNNYFYVTLSVIVFLAFLEILVSKTKNGRMVNSVISLLAVTMLLLPIVSLIKSDENLIKNDYYSEYANKYLIELEKKVVYNKIVAVLDSGDHKATKVELDFSIEDVSLTLEKITVYFDSTVINEKGEHIDMLESVKNSLSTVVDVQKVEIKIETN